MSTAIAVQQLNNEQVDLIKRTICYGSTDDELQLFIAQCNRTGLDPFSKQIHAVKRWDNRLKREVMSIQVGVDGFRLVAERSGKLDGQGGPYWCGDDGVWRDVWLSERPPVAAKVLVFRIGCTHPFVGVARFSAYAQTTRDGNLNSFWSRMPDVMIAKVAECLAIRKAFPQDLSGLYSPEEMVIETDAFQPPIQRQNASPAISDKATSQQQTKAVVATNEPFDDGLLTTATKKAIEAALAALGRVWDSPTMELAEKVVGRKLGDASTLDDLSEAEGVLLMKALNRSIENRAKQPKQ